MKTQLLERLEVYQKLKLSSVNIVILSFFPLNVFISGEMELFLLKFSFCSTRFSQYFKNFPQKKKRKAQDQMASLVNPTEHLNN